MEKLWHHMFHNELKIKPTENHLMVSVPPDYPEQDSEKYGEQLVEVNLLQFPTFKYGNSEKKYTVALAIYDFQLFQEFLK